jgi:quinol monooxygenase YgiN
MYVRLLSIRIKPALVEKHQDFYQREVMPALRASAGCLYASLLHAPGRLGECVSFTVWKDLAGLRAYEEDGNFDELMRKSQEYLAESTEWKLELSEDLTLEPKQVPNDPVPRCYAVQAATGECATMVPGSQSACLRLVRGTFNHNSLEAARRVYEEEVIPLLHSVKGCRHACLLGSLDSADELVSLTMWDSEEDIANYETSALFRGILERAQPMLSAVCQWKVTLEESHGLHAITSEDVKIQSYAAVTGTSFV